MLQMGAVFNELGLTKRWLENKRNVYNILSCVGTTFLLLSQKKETSGTCRDSLPAHQSATYNSFGDSGVFNFLSTLDAASSCIRVAMCTDMEFKNGFNFFSKCLQNVV